MSPHKCRTLILDQYKILCRSAKVPRWAYEIIKSTYEANKGKYPELTSEYIMTVWFDILNHPIDKELLRAIHCVETRDLNLKYYFA